MRHLTSVAATVVVIVVIVLGFLIAWAWQDWIPGLVIMLAGAGLVFMTGRR